jgi:minor extracellular protease Epr
MTRTHLPWILFALALLAVLDHSRVLPGGLFADPAYAQDDDDDDDDDDDRDDDDDGADRTPDREPRVSPGRTSRSAPVPRSRRAPVAAAPANLPVRAEGEIVVSGLSEGDLAALQAEGFVVIENLAILRNGPVLYRLRVPAGNTLEEARDRVRTRDSGRNADFNHYYRSGQTVTPAAAPAASVAPVPPAPCNHLNCRTLDQIAWPDARSADCRAALDIGLIDTSVNVGHAGLSAAQVELVRVAAADLAPSGETHGTAVVALLAGSELRAPGLLPEANIIAVDIFSREGGDERADVAHLVQALDLLSQRGVRLANLSLAGPENTVLSDMLKAVADSGMLVVAAAGNAGPTAPPAWPAAAETVLAVTAVDRADRIYRRAQRGAHIDLAAPGVEVWSAASVRGVKPRTGTSFAAPFATAAAAILMSRDPALTPAQAIETLRGLTRDIGAEGSDEVFGAGVLSLAGLCDAPAK